MKPFALLSIYNVITLVITILLLILCKKLIKKDDTKDFILKFTSVLVVVIHFSSLYVDFFANNGDALIENSMLLPVYPCNIIMWLLLIVAFMKDRNSMLFKYLAEFTFIGGTFCGLVGVLFNINFLNNPNFMDYYILKGLVSHTVMIFGTVYLYLFDYVKIEVKRTTISIVIGLLIFSVIGLIINVLFAIFDIPGVNAMFMLEPPIKELPILNFFTIGISGMLFSFLGLNIYEYYALPKEKRWITNFKKGGEK
jgi:hypothetical protein